MGNFSERRQGYRCALAILLFPITYPIYGVGAFVIEALLDAILNAFVPL